VTAFTFRGSPRDAIVVGSSERPSGARRNVADQHSDDVSVVGQGARIEGTLNSTGSLRIHGRLSGEIAVDGDVSVAAGSDVRADINARSISLAGRVKGNLTAPGEVVLPSQSRVEGDVRAQSVTVHGAVDGDVVAEQSVKLGREARVEGDVTCRTLAIEEGAFFVGRSIMSDKAAG
jgi:cytoskeletal protein CcmA (bactofilin family)